MACQSPPSANEPGCLLDAHTALLLVGTGAERGPQLAPIWICRLGPRAGQTAALSPGQWADKPFCPGGSASYEVPSFPLARELPCQRVSLLFSLALLFGFLDWTIEFLCCCVVFFTFHLLG